MKTTLTVLFTSLIALASVAQGNSYRTLNGYKDAIEIKKGETAFIVTATARVVLGVQNPGKREFQYRFAEPESRSFYQSGYQSGSSSYRNRNLLPAPSVNSPVPIVGPAKLILRTSGMLTLMIPQEARRPATTSSRSVRRFAKN